MEKRNHIFYLAVGFGLLFLLPVAESVDKSLGQVATFLVIGYWAMLGFAFLLFVLKNLFAGYGINTLLYNIWLCVSLMSVAVGVLAIVDNGIEQARWAVVLILYGSTVGFLNRKEL